MKDIIQILREKAKKDPKLIAFPEVEDPRVQEALKYIEKEGIAKPLVITPDTIELEKQKEFAQVYFERKKIRGISFDEAMELMSNPLYYSAMMASKGYADGFVAGAKFTSSSVVRATLSCLETDKDAGIISSCFLMVIPECAYGQEGVLLYADCAVIPNPSSEQLALIGISTAKFTKEVLGFDPRVAFLSFSSKGSSQSRWTDKVKEAVQIAQSKNTEFAIDGELQADSALVPEVAKIKTGDSPVAGKANVLIFPNLDSGNICYKLTERLAKARAVGPIILGTKQPSSDLSRGCSVDDVIDCAAVTVIRAQNK
jgi:phosphate acetyltransferase